MDKAEAWRTSPTVTELARRARHTQVFLKMAAIELRRIAERTPDKAAELLFVAQKLLAEAEDLARHDVTPSAENNGRCFTSLR